MEDYEEIPVFFQCKSGKTLHFKKCQSSLYKTCVTMINLSLSTAVKGLIGHVSIAVQAFIANCLYQMCILSVQERTRKALKRNEMVVMLNGSMVRDCAHFTRQERQLSRQVACNYWLNQFSASVFVCVRELV